MAQVPFSGHDCEIAGHPIFAALYDRLLAGAERAGLAELRAGLIADARGETLEIGAGTGANLKLYPPAVTSLSLAEPDPHMARRLEQRLGGEATARPAELVAAPAERLPFADASFDTVVATLVLCTVDEPARAAAEVARVLRPGGELLVLEHVRAPGAGRARWQDRLERPWGWFAGGCHPNRDTAATLAAAGFDVSGLRPGELPGVGPLVRPAIRGSARLASG